MLQAYDEPAHVRHLQDRFHWTDFLVGNIAWKSLKLALKVINNPTTTCKTCNDLLPTATRLNQQNYQSSAKCPICDEEENTQHLFQCKHPSRIKWRIGCIKQLREGLQKMNTHEALTDTICSCLTKWMDTNTVTIEKHPQFHCKAVL